MDNRKVVTLMRFNVLGKAEVYKTLLEANGIRASLTHDMIHSVLPLGTSGALSIELVVLEENAARAQEILDAHYDEAEFAEETRVEPKKQRRCCCRKKVTGE